MESRRSGPRSTPRFLVYGRNDYLVRFFHGIFILLFITHILITALLSPGYVYVKSRLTSNWYVLQSLISAHNDPYSAVKPSPKVAIIRFERGMQQGLLGRISRSSIMEYHAFGIISLVKFSVIGPGTEQFLGKALKPSIII